MNTVTKINGDVVTSYSTKETAIAIRAALKSNFPTVKFSVRTRYGSMYSATDISWTDGPTEKEVELVTDRFTSKTFDGSDDSTHYHTQETATGERVQYSGWVNTHRDVSPALLQKALDRYNVERSLFGAPPARLSVVLNGSYPYVDGADKSALDPCASSFRSTWCPDAVNAIAATMRPNGVRVMVKSRY